MAVGAHAAEPFTNFNLVVRQNLASTSEVEGRAAIGGSLSGPASNYGVG
ncbi:MAG: collagen-binding domain-containing protein [Phycisphaerales bacterium]